MQDIRSNVRLLIEAGWFSRRELAKRLNKDHNALWKWLIGQTNKMRVSEDAVIDASCHCAIQNGKKIDRSNFNNGGLERFASVLGIDKSVVAKFVKIPVVDLEFFHRCNVLAHADATSYEGVYYIYRESSARPSMLVKAYAKIYLGDGFLQYEDWFDGKEEYKGYVLPMNNILNIIGENKNTATPSELFWCGLVTRISPYRGWVSDIENTKPDVHRILFKKENNESLWRSCRDDALENEDKRYVEDGEIGDRLATYLRNIYIKDE